MFPPLLMSVKIRTFYEPPMLNGVNSHVCHEPFTEAVCFNVIITDFALCFFMVLDLRLKIVGCRETADFSFYIDTAPTTWRKNRVYTSPTASHRMPLPPPPLLRRRSG